MTWTLWLGSDLDPELPELGGQRLDRTNWQRWLAGPWHSRAWTHRDLLPEQEISPGRYHATSRLWDVIQAAPQVRYRAWPEWSDEPPRPQLPRPYDGWHHARSQWSWVPARIETEFLMAQLREQRPGALPDPEPPPWPEACLEVVAPRPDPGACLWIVGCSIAVGHGVQPAQRWGQLLADHWQRPTAWLVRRGSSLEWQSDQISRADIRGGDRVVWGLTSELRMACCRAGYIVPWPGVGDRDVGANELFDETQWYRAVTQVTRVRDLMALRGADLALLPCLATPRLVQHIRSWPHRVRTAWQPGWQDLGRDSWHPGPRQHRSWADSVIDHWPGAW